MKMMSRTVIRDHKEDDDDNDDDGDDDMMMMIMMMIMMMMMMMMVMMMLQWTGQVVITAGEEAMQGWSLQLVFSAPLDYLGGL